MNEFFNYKLNNRAVAVIMLLMVFIFIGIIYLIKDQNNKMIETLESSYNRAFYDLVEYMDDTEKLLAKLQISNSQEYIAKNLNDVWRKADLAQNSLSQIPIRHITLEKVVQFLNQLSDYSYSLSQKIMRDEPVTDEDFKNIKNYYEKCEKLNETLSSLMNDMTSGSISWSELNKDDERNFFAQEVSNISKDSFSKITESMQDYEGLIYDGPFSEHMSNIEPRGLGSGEITSGDALKIVYEYVNKESIKEIKGMEILKTTIPVFAFDVTLKDDSMLFLDITKQGGNVLWCMSDRAVQIIKISTDEAKKKGKKFLENHGIYDMVDTYYVLEGGMATINYAYKDGDIVCYPDLIKVKVSLEDGSILGMEANRYFTSHVKRNYQLPQISLKEAREKINSQIEINYEGIALIPTEWNTEILAYEFKGKVEDRDFIVYINTITGKEEKIFMIVDTPNGVLTV